MTSLVVAFVVLSALAGGGAPTRRVTGTVAEFHAGEWMLVTNEAMRVEVLFREATSYEGPDQDSRFDPAALKLGARVTVWYRSVAERRPVADKVRVLTAVPAAR